MQPSQARWGSALSTDQNAERRRFRKHVEGSSLKIGFPVPSSQTRATEFRLSRRSIFEATTPSLDRSLVFRGAERAERASEMTFSEFPVNTKCFLVRNAKHQCKPIRDRCYKAYLVGSQSFSDSGRLVKYDSSHEPAQPHAQGTQSALHERLLDATQSSQCKAKVSSHAG